MTGPRLYAYEIECLDCGAISEGRTERPEYPGVIDMPDVCWKERCRSRHLDLHWEGSDDD